MEYLGLALFRHGAVFFFRPNLRKYAPVIPRRNGGKKPSSQSVYFSQEKQSISCRSDMRNEFLARN